MCEHRVQYCGDCIVYAPITAVGKQCGWEGNHHLCQNQPLKALHDNGSECNRAVVNEARQFFWHRHDGRGLETCWHSSLGKGQVENVSKWPSELLRTCPEHTYRNTVRTSSLASVDPAQ